MRLTTLFKFVPVVGILLFTILAVGCSSGGPTSPGLTSDPMLQQAIDVPGMDGAENHNLFATYKLILSNVEDEAGNVVDVDIELIPQRTEQVHVNVKDLVLNMCPQCVWFVPKSGTPDGLGMVVEANVFFRNPTQLTGYDVRGIIYPTAVGAELRGPWIEETQRWDTPDGLTTLYNSGEAQNENAYMAFNNTDMVSKRSFGPQKEYGRTYYIWKDLGYPLAEMTYKIDVSFPGNAEEPVDCYFYDPFDPDEEYIYPNGSNEWIYARLTDWQNNISTVSLDLSNFGISTPVGMVKVGDDPVNYTSTWRYHLTEPAGTPANLRTIRLIATSWDADKVYMKDLRVRVTWDADKPKWSVPGQEGIYNHVGTPDNLWLFFHEAWDVSVPVSYKFWGNDVPSPFDGDPLKVVLSTEYTGWTAFGVSGAPGGVDRVYGLAITDSQNQEPEYTLYWEDYSATRYDAAYRWSFIKDQPPGSDGIYGGVALGDVTGDGVDDIVVGSRNHIVYVYEGNGAVPLQDTIYWEFDTGGEVHNTPAIVDLNGDSRLDVVVASDSTNVYALDAVTGLPIWTHTPGLDFLMHSSPSIAYMNSDNTPDVVIGTGDGRMLVLDGTDGTEMWSFQAGSGIAGTAGLADVNLDGTPDLCFGAYDNKIYMIDGSTHQELWSVGAVAGLNNIDCSPAMVDISGDGKADCIIGGRDSAGAGKGVVYAFRGDTGDELWVNQDIWGNCRRTPTPVHLNDDLIWDFIVVCYQGEHRTIYGLNGINGHVLFQTLGPNIPEDKVVNCSDPIVGDFTSDGHMNAVIGMGSIQFPDIDGFVDLYSIAYDGLPTEWLGRHIYRMQVSLTADKKEFIGPIAMGDVDGDGEWELVCANMRGYTYIWDMGAPMPEDISLRGWCQFMGNRWHNGIPEFIPPDE